MNNLDFETIYRKAVTHKGERLLPPAGEAEAIFNFMLDIHEGDLEDSEDECTYLEQELARTTLELKKLSQHKDATVGLYAIDKNPIGATLDYIRHNSFIIEYK